MLRKILIVAACLFPITVFAAVSTISQGGTNTGIAPSANSLVSFDGSKYTSTTTSPLRVGSLTSTTTATSTFAGGISLSGGCVSVGGVCVGGSTSVAGYPFALSGNATSTLTQFNGGLTAFATSTIGNSTAAGGLTISGNATTTGNVLIQAATNSTGSFTAKNAAGTTYFALDSTNRNIYAGNFGGSSFTIGTASGKLTGFNGAVYGWVSQSTSDTNAADTGFSRLSPGVIAVGTGLSNSIAGTLVDSKEGIGTTSPLALLTVSDNTANANTTAFLISSSTAIATSTLLSVDNRGQVVDSDTVQGNTGVLSPTVNGGFTYATSTAWTATTTLPLPPFYYASILRGVKCKTNTGTLNVDFYYGSGPTHVSLLNASTTIGSYAWTANNTPAVSDAFSVDIGTPASSPTSITCTIARTTTAQ